MDQKMDNPILMDWQRWESRMQEWLALSDENDLDLEDTTPLDRMILIVLTIKYQVSYQGTDELECDPNRRLNEQREKTEPISQTTQAIHIDNKDRSRSIVKLSRSKLKRDDEKKVDDLEQVKSRCALFDEFTGRMMSPEQASHETSSEWQEFLLLYDWHGPQLLSKFIMCLRRLVSEWIAATSAYRQLIQEPKRIVPMPKIENGVFVPKNDGQIFVSIDMKSANFSSLQQIQAIDAQTYPTWADFLSTFVGSRPLILLSKGLRLRTLGLLPEYHKLEAFWTHFTATVYQTIICPCLLEKAIDAVCVALGGDEVVFRLTSIDQEKLIDFVHHLQQTLDKIPIVTFHVRAYRLQMFLWKNQHRCFARVFLGREQPSFDLKCLRHKAQNYDQAYADCRVFLGL